MRTKLVITGEADVILKPEPLASGSRNEAWLRDMMLKHPDALPVAEIDPAFADPVPICRELRTPAGPIDGLFINKDGALVLMECKLWRNPEARREVVGQILDYAKELAKWRYEDLQREVSAARDEPGRNAAYEAVAGKHPEVQEAVFVDQVSRNLANGRFLLLVVGDGIREGTEGIVQYVARYSGLHFVFGLVEVVGYTLPDGRLMVQPQILARTTNIERSVIRIESSLPTADISIIDPEDGEVDSETNGITTGFAPEFLEADRAFWPRFISAVTFDDPSQPKPKKKGFANSRADIGVSFGWFGFYASRANNIVGCYANFKGEAGFRLYERLLAERQDIEADIRSSGTIVSEIDWNSLKGFSYITLKKRNEGKWEPSVEQSNLIWLCEAGNAMVNAIRPRVQRLATEI